MRDTISRPRFGRFAACAVLLSALGVLGCPQEVAVWVESGSTASRLVFGISDERGGRRAVQVGGLRVDACDRDDYGPGAHWLVSPDSANGSPRRIQYGVPPRGWRTTEGPLPLTAGCYRVSTSGTGRTRFDVSEDGRVAERR